MFDSIEERITLATDEVQYEVHLSMMVYYFIQAVYDYNFCLFFLIVNFFFHFMM